MNWIFEEF